MSYCEDCGLTSCYIRGGTCDTTLRKRTKKPRVLWVPKDDIRWYFIEDPYPQWDDSQWIEVIW